VPQVSAKPIQTPHPWYYPQTSVTRIAVSTAERRPDHRRGVEQRRTFLNWQETLVYEPVDVVLEIGELRTRGRELVDEKASQRILQWLRQPVRLSLVQNTSRDESVYTIDQRLRRCAGV
jgi:hypothetical protein